MSGPDDKRRGLIERIGQHSRVIEWTVIAVLVAVVVVHWFTEYFATLARAQVRD